VGLVAQLVEQLTFNQRVVGSNPAELTKCTGQQASTSFLKKRSKKLLILLNLAALKDRDQALGLLASS
jgi:hypothetical protein